jgi:hypothetical protein
MEQATTVLLLVRRDTTTHEPFRALGTTVCEKREGSGFALVGGAYIYIEKGARESSYASRAHAK